MREKGFWAVLVGGGVGGFLGLWPGLFIAAFLLDAFGWGTGGLEDIGWALVGAAVGAWLGCSAGAYLLMRVMRVTARGSTAAWLTVLSPLMGLASWVSVGLNDSETLNVDWFNLDWVFYALAALSGPVVAFLARRLGLRSEASRGSSETSI